ncbi:uncharacterized protein LOC106662123 isoform X2 [Cimex lectularius]|uniref:ALMS motif domain-containing protein n=1 Tax=Cimex lectularius TaxID=79782 RepID=A0A8I6SEL2_CIMLE|nr:uncharacterized protein LOC106662123 isoform X2 [Cimex lectularius]
MFYAMGEEESSDDEASRDCARHPKSTYFQTEFTISINKRPEECESKESGDEYVTGKYEKSKRKVSISVQADEDIITEKCSDEESKKWERPPLVGQASTELFSDDEIIDDTYKDEQSVYVSTDDYPNRKDYAFERPPEGASLEQRVPSPASASSLVSVKPLEWDSGADVGYFPGGQGDAQLSTIERMALNGSRLKRSDPEGTPCTNGPPPLQPLGPPEAESTPISTNGNTKNTTEADEPKQYPLFPEVIKEMILVNQHEVSDSEVEEQRVTSSPTLSNAAIRNIKEFYGSATFPRSQCQTSVSQELNPRIRQLAFNKSNSSSSVATVVKNRAQSAQSQVDSKPSETDSVQTAANSFEYLPGDKYEPPDESPNLKRDVERGVKLLGEFMKDAGANDTLTKKQLLKKVVDGLLEKRYPEDEEWEASIFQGERCMTRRSQNRDDVSGQSTPVDENSHDSVLSRMEKSAAEGHSASSASCQGKKSNSTSNHSSRSDSRPKAEGQVPPAPIPPPPQAKTSSSNERSKADSVLSAERNRKDWRIPQTKAEHLYELEKSKDKNKAMDDRVLQFISSERENQLEWIKKEINHLSNLKKLLEKHETLKKNFAHLKNSKERTKSMLESKYSRKQRDIQKSSSAPLKRPVENHLSSDQSSWLSHKYERSSGNLLRRNASTNTGLSVVTEITKLPKKSVAYTIIFQDSDKENGNVHSSERGRKVMDLGTDPDPPRIHGVTIADREELKRSSRDKVKEHLSHLKLQDELMAKKPDYIVRAENRRQVVAELAAHRELRQQNKDKILAAAMSNEAPHPCEIPLKPLVKRIVSQKEMRSQTEKKYKGLAEIKQKQLEQRRQQDYQTNRLMADLFKRKLQRKVLYGQTDLSNSVNVISSC